jgi:hypothetical protein
MLDTNLRFLVGSNISSSASGTTTNKIGIEQCFIITKSNVSTGTQNTPLFIQSAKDKARYITYNNAGFIMSSKGKDKQGLFQQSFFFEKSRINDSEQGEKIVSVKLVDPKNALYIAFENKMVKAYAESPQVQAMNNMSFAIRTIPFQMHIRIITLFGGSMKSMSGGVIGVLENNTTDGTTYIIEPGVITNRNFNYLTDNFYLVNAETGKYLGMDMLTGFLNDSQKVENESYTRLRLHIETSKGYFQIVNSDGKYLVLMNKNLLKFEKKELIVSNENLFQIDLKYII